jgi:hypothetical protein
LATLIAKSSWLPARRQDPQGLALTDTLKMLMVKIRQPSHEFTFGVGISFIPYQLVLTPVVHVDFGV